MENIRLKRFRQEIQDRNIDCALIYSGYNRNYLSGFTGDDSYIVITGKEAIFITDSRYTEQAENEVVDFEVRKHNDKIEDYIIELVKSLDIRQLGFEENHMAFDMYEKLSNGLEKIEFIKLNGIVEKLRQVKDENEVKNIEKAASIADQAFNHVLELIKPGITEWNIGLELEYFMKSKGASGLSFPSIVASGERSSLPHGSASQKKIVLGDFLTLDFGCVYNGYCSDMTRTLVIGKATEKQKEIYNTVLEANIRALGSIRPGITGESIDSVARNFISSKGYGDYFGHGLGHGVGVQVHELPYISKKGITPLESGMVVTDEPGIYIPGYGGVRIEELVIVTENGCKVLSKSDKNLIEIV